MTGTARTRAIVVALLCACALTLGACAPKAGPTAAPDSGSASVTTAAPETSAPASAPATPSATTTVAEPPVAEAVGSEATAYAEQLGGTSHDGEPLYLLVGASETKLPAAQKALDEAIPYFGDMQSYFIVQRSDNFAGLKPGYWVIVEAYRTKPSSENLEFGRRAFPDAYVKRVTVRTADPIPVYEDMVGD